MIAKQTPYVDFFVRCKFPDPMKIERFRRIPELGPAILFFSGGTAMRETAHLLSQYTHNAVHVMTPFDSGGSSAALRQAFDMPAVGDIRSRIMALADQSVKGNPAIYQLFASRFSKTSANEDLLEELLALCQNKHELIKAVPDPMRKIIRNNLMQFVEAMPDDFPLQGASVGNLVLTGGYLSNRRHLDSIIFIYSKLVEARGIVRPVVNKVAHLAVELQSGQVIVGQHNFTGKESCPISSPIHKAWLTASIKKPDPISISIRPKMKELISKAELICYPFGSFYSSLLANLLPEGVGKAISSTRCPKVFIPNLGNDPELVGYTLQDQVSTLLHYLRKNQENVAVSSVLNFIILDIHDELYNGPIPKAWLESLGIKLIRMPIVSPKSFPYACPKQVTEALLSLC